MKLRPAVFLLSVCLLTFSQSAGAQWALNGTPATTANGNQLDCQMIPDGSGGAIIVWFDVRSGIYGDIYAQKLDAWGVPKWALDGVAVCVSVNEQYEPVLCSDGAGGCIVAWSDYRSGNGSDIWAQRINSAGGAQWAANGVLIANPALGGDQFSPCIVSDGAGGAIIAWGDSRSGPDDIYAQRINSTGVVQWVAHGKSVAIAAGTQQYPQICSDGASGAIITWNDFRSGTSYDVYAQRTNSAGTAQWVAGGVGVCTLAGGQINPAIVTDGAGGAIIAWEDDRSQWDVYAQRLNSSGALQWITNGVDVCTATGDQLAVSITTDGLNGAIIAWEDPRSGDYDIFARRVSASGVPQWQYQGVPICTQQNAQTIPSIDSDGAGGAVLSWKDSRNGDIDLYAQRIDRNGVELWDDEGVVVNDRDEDTNSSQIVWSAGSAIVAWTDVRNLYEDIYAQRVDGRFGSWGHPEPQVTSVADVRSDQGGHVKVNWKASNHDALGYTSVIPVNYYTVWRATDVVAMTASNGAGDASTLVVEDPSRVPSGYTGKAFYVQHAPAADYYWELAGTQTALKIFAYSFSAETRADSVLGNSATHRFMVAAHTPNEFTHWPSNEMAGRSVDNLSPPAPLFLTAQRAGSSVVLKWNHVRVPDLRNYSVYRKTSAGVTPLPPNFLANSDDSVLVDTNAPQTPLYYIVTATDVHANQGSASNEAAVSSSTGAGNTPAITSLMVMQNRPNPFATSASFDLGLPASSRVDIEVYDIAGRRVTSRSLGTMPSGWRTVNLDALDDVGKPLASGVYFYRIKAAGDTVTRKMVIAR